MLLLELRLRGVPFGGATHRKIMPEFLQNAPHPPTSNGVHPLSPRLCITRGVAGPGVHQGEDLGAMVSSAYYGSAPLNVSLGAAPPTNTDLPPFHRTAPHRLSCCLLLPRGAEPAIRTRLSVLTPGKARPLTH